MYRIRKTFHFEAAHRLDRAYSTACTKQIHGHSYRVEVFLVAQALDQYDMVIDFGIVKEMVEAIIERYDHALILPNTMQMEYDNLPGEPEDEDKVIWMDCNPTAECMAYDIYQEMSDALRSVLNGTDTSLEKVRVHETETGWAEYCHPMTTAKQKGRK